MSFAPPLFKDIGKSLSDLFSKKYDFTSSAKLKTKTAGGVSFQTQLYQKGSGSFKGKFYQPDIQSTVEEEVGTCGKFKVSVTNDTAVEGAKLKVTGNAQDLSATVDVTYRRDAVAATVVADVSADVQQAEATATVGFDGLTVGAQAKYDAVNGDVTDFNAGGQYEGSDFTVAVKTANEADRVTASFIHRRCSKLTVGGRFEYAVEEDTRELTVGGEYKVSESSLVRAKVNHRYRAAAVFEHRLASHDVTVGVAGAFDLTKGSTVPEEFGLSFVFGSCDIK